MGIEWDDKRSAAGRVRVVLGTWPGTRAAREIALANSGLAGSFSARHAQSVWSDAVADVARSASALGTEIESRAGLAMVAALASHLGACDRCWRTGPYGSDTPISWLMWACSRRPVVAKVLAPILGGLAGVKLPVSVQELRT